MSPIYPDVGAFSAAVSAGLKGRSPPTIFATSPAGGGAETGEGADEEEDTPFKAAATVS